MHEGTQNGEGDVAPVAELVGVIRPVRDAFVEGNDDRPLIAAKLCPQV
jgi:hypothetical protein